MENLGSPLSRQLHDFPLALPSIFEHFNELEPEFVEEKEVHIPVELSSYFPHASALLLQFQYDPKSQKAKSKEKTALKVGVFFSGGQAPGGHNVILGLFEALKRWHPLSQLIGFLNGPKGLLVHACKELTQEIVYNYKNEGGFDLLGSGRDKIEKEEDLELVKRTVLSEDLDGLVVIGGDDSNTNAAYLAEYFAAHQVKCKVIGVPKTIDGDLKNRYIEIPFGFDTAAKVYAQTISNLARDALSAKKYYFFVKIMGRSASHLALEVAIQSHPNLTLIGEEIAQNKKTLKQIVEQIADMVCERSRLGKEYGVIVIPEGIVEFIEDFGHLIKEVNKLIASKKEVVKNLKGELAECFNLLPQAYQRQLLLERDPHGNVPVSKIESERLLMDLTANELLRRKKRGEYDGEFNAQPYFCGYEGRSCAPSLFDAHYCYALGFTAALLVRAGVNGYMATLSSLTRSVAEWEPKGVPIVSMMRMEQRNGKLKPVVGKAYVDLHGIAYRLFEQNISDWSKQDAYRYVGPIQYFGPKELTSMPALTLMLEETPLVMQEA